MLNLRKTWFWFMGIGFGCIAASPVLAQGGWGDNEYFDVSTSGFIRIESALSTSSKRNPYNQIGNPFNGVAVDRLDLFGGSDTYVRQGPQQDEDFNLSVLRGKFDVNVSLNRNWSFRGELRALFDVNLYKNFHLNDIPGANPLGRLDRKPNLFEYRVNGGSLMSRKNPGALEVSGKRFMMDLPRFYLDYHKGPLHVRMGNQQIAWGQSLFFRVMDVPNGLDLRRHSLLDYVPEEFSDKRVPSLAVRVQYMAGSWELDGFVQHFRPTIYGNPNTPYNVIASQFTVHDLYKDYDDKFNFGMRARGDIGPIKFQAMAARRYNPDGTFRWTQSGVHKPLGPGFEGTEGLMAATAYEQDTTGVHSAREWFTFAGLARLDGVNGLNASIAEFPAAQALGAVLAPDYTFAAQELDLFFRLSGGLRGHIAREYHRESLFGVGFGYVFNGAPGSLFDQLIANVEIQYAKDRHFTNPSLSQYRIVEDEAIVSVVLEKYQRFTPAFPATYFVLQWMHRTESDIFGRHLSGMGGSVDRAARDASTPGSANYIAFALQQPFPNLVWRLDLGMLYDLEGGILIQPALRWRPGNNWAVEAFYNFIDGGVRDRNPNYNALSTTEWADEFTLRIGYEF